PRALERRRHRDGPGFLVRAVGASSGLDLIAAARALLANLHKCARDENGAIPRPSRRIGGHLICSDAGPRAALARSNGYPGSVAKSGPPAAIGGGDQDLARLAVGAVNGRAFRQDVVAAAKRGLNTESSKLVCNRQYRPEADAIKANIIWVS